MEQGKDGEEDMDGKSTTTSGANRDQEKGKSSSPNREGSPLSSLEKKTKGDDVSTSKLNLDNSDNKIAKVGSVLIKNDRPSVQSSKDGPVVVVKPNVNSDSDKTPLRDVKTSEEKSDKSVLGSKNSDRVGAIKPRTLDDDKGNDGGDEADKDDREKDKLSAKPKLKRRLGDAAAPLAPAPKIKRMKKPESSKADQKKDEVYRRQVEKQKQREKAAAEASEEENKSKEEKARKKTSSDDESDDADPLKKRLKHRGGLSAMPKVKNTRRNIRDIMTDDKLEEGTLAAQKEEKLRLQRLQEKRAALMEYLEQQQVERLVTEISADLEAVAQVEAEAEASGSIIEAAELQLPLGVEIKKEIEEPGESLSLAEEGDKTEMKEGKPAKDSDIVVLSSEEEPEQEEESLFGEMCKVKEEQTSRDGSEDDGDDKSKLEKSLESKTDEECAKDGGGSDGDSDIMILSEHSSDEEEVDDVNNSGAHINDEFNVVDAQGRVLVNVGHPENEEDIFLAPQLASAVKPHQIGGIRFLYDNIIESVEQYKSSNGFGCILAHSMGLGKTLQIVCFTDVFLRNTDAKTILIIVPINTLQNWQSEFNSWLPENMPEGPLPEGVTIQTRNFKVFLINDVQKNLQSRAKVINEWYKQGGVLLMGYELYRQLAMKKPKKPKKKKKKGEDNSEIVDIEEEDKNKEILEELQEALVKPGPDLIICDEGHRIKNAHANISQALKSIQTKRRVVLTGYPLQNNLMEYWCMVDFVRPNYLGTKTEFSNMFERPIQNGQCVDSTPQDKKLMRYRAHVLHSLLEGFVQRRGHTVLRKTLPPKHEHVILCRMTEIQRKLYTTFMAELSNNKAVANPLKAFAVCCKIWNHPDVLYNFVMKKIKEDYDLDLDEVVGKGPGRGKRGGAHMHPGSHMINRPPWMTDPMHPRGMPNQNPNQPNLNMPPNPMGMHGNMPPHLPTSTQSPMMPQPPGGQNVSGFNMGNAYMSQGNNYGMQQQMQQYPWYNPNFNPNNPNNQNQQFPNYNNPYSNMQFPHQQQSSQQPQGPQQQMQMQQHLPATQSLPGFPSMMHDSNMQMNMDPNSQNNQGMPRTEAQNSHNIHQPGSGQGQGMMNQPVSNNSMHPADLRMDMIQNGSGIPSDIHTSESMSRSPDSMNMSLHHSGTHSQPHSVQSSVPSDGQMSQVMSHVSDIHPLNTSVSQQQSSGVMSQGGNNSGIMSQGGNTMNRGLPMNPNMMQQSSRNNSPQGLPQNNQHSQMVQESTESLQHMSLQNNQQQNGQMSDQQNCETLSQDGHMTPGPMTPGSMTGPMTPSSMTGPMTPGQPLPSPQTPGSYNSNNPTPGPANPGQQMMDHHMGHSIPGQMMPNPGMVPVSQPLGPMIPGQPGFKLEDNQDAQKGNPFLNGMSKVEKEEKDIKDPFSLECKETLPNNLEEMIDKKHKIEENMNMLKKERMDDDDDKKEDKKEEITFDWAEPLFKGYMPGLLANSSKFQIFFKILECSLCVGDRLLVFSQSLFTLSMLEEFLQRSYIPGTFEGWAKNRSYFRLDGSTSAQEREKLINEFNSNPTLKLFLVSTRAGSLGINLAGANRVVVFDASFNPCHDTQAVCRVYRYGQQKESYIYRLVTDFSLEKRIYDRQINKQGISDRILDELNPDAHLSSKEISNLMVEIEEEDKEEDLAAKVDTFSDPILKDVVNSFHKFMTKLPFKHESLLVDRKDKKLSKTEKRLAKRSYELEKQANISYTRPSYAAFYPKHQGGQPVMMGTKIGGVVYAKPVGTVRPMQQDSHRMEPGGIHRPNILSRGGSSNFPVEALAKQGVSVQQITVPKALSIPTNTGDGKPIQLQAGQSVMVIKTQKGTYLRLSDGKIVAIRVPPGSENFGLPLNQGSVTIVPTVGSHRPRPRGPGRGGSRRGRPPMSAQYALGQVVPKGPHKGQMAVRIMRKQVMGGRGGKYQSIVPTPGPHTLLNKSVVITPANRSGIKMGRGPKMLHSPIGSKGSGVSVSLIPGTSGMKGPKLHASSTGNILDTAKELAKNAQNPFGEDREDDSFMDEYDKEDSSNDGRPGEKSISNSDSAADDEVANESQKTPYTGMSNENQEHADFSAQDETGKGSPMSSERGNNETVKDSSDNSKSSNNPSQSESNENKSNISDEPITGVVKPQMQQPPKEMGIAPLESMSNLMSPDSMSLSSNQSTNFLNSNLGSTTSQPLFQPFLQGSSTNSSTSTNTTDRADLPRNVAQVAPQIQPPTSSSFISSLSQSQEESPTHTPLPPFTSNSEINSTTNTSLPSISHITGSHSVSRADVSGESPLSLSNLLGSPSFEKNSESTTLTHSSPSLDYLNYPLTSGSSAFRRPEFPGSLTPDLQSLMTSTSPLASSNLPTPPPAHSNSSLSVTSGSLTPQPSAYSQYASPYQTTSTTSGFRSPPSMAPGTYPTYPSQYPYSSQYSGLSPSSTPQPSAGQYGNIQTPPPNPYQNYPASTPTLPPYSPGLSGFGHGPYPPM